MRSSLLAAAAATLLLGLSGPAAAQAPTIDPPDEGSPDHTWRGIHSLVRFGVQGRYHLVPSFAEPIANRRNHSGPQLSLLFGLAR